MFQKYKYRAFTLAEVLVVLVVLGFIAAITLPALMERATSGQNKTTIKKAMEAYDRALSKAVIENNLRSNEALEQWADGDGNCTRGRSLFKVAQDGPDGCTFKASDGLWWYIKPITNPIVSFVEINPNNPEQTLEKVKGYASDSSNEMAFYLVSDFDANGSFRANDYQIAEGDNKKYIKKIYKYMGQKPTKASSQVCVETNGEERCVERRESTNSSECNFVWGYVARVNGRGSGSINIRPSSCTIDEFNNDTGDNPGSKMACGADASTGKHGCVIGGYGCEVTTADEIQCHINGGEVSDIAYNMNGEVTAVLCNSWNASCRNSSLPDPKTQCKTACCSYDSASNSWKSCAGEEDQYLWTKAVCELIQLEGKSLPDSCNEYMND